MISVNTGQEFSRQEALDNNDNNGSDHMTAMVSSAIFSVNAGQEFSRQETLTHYLISFEIPLLDNLAFKIMCLKNIYLLRYFS